MAHMIYTHSGYQQRQKNGKTKTNWMANKTQYILLYLCIEVNSFLFAYVSYCKNHLSYVSDSRWMPLSLRIFYYCGSDTLSDQSSTVEKTMSFVKIQCEKHIIARLTLLNVYCMWCANGEVTCLSREIIIPLHIMCTEIEFNFVYTFFDGHIYINIWLSACTWARNEFNEMLQCMQNFWLALNLPVSMHFNDFTWLIYCLKIFSLYLVIEVRSVKTGCYVVLYVLKQCTNKKRVISFSNNKVYCDSYSWRI